MKLVQATVKGNPRQVTTKYGDRLVADCLIGDGQEVTIWRPSNDAELMSRANGERVTLAVDSKGKYHLMESLSSGLVSPSETASSQENHSGNRAPEIRDYVNRLAKLYSYTFKTVCEQMSDSNLPIECLKDISTSVFIQTTRHFDI